jgi:hypothetical protein
MFHSLESSGNDCYGFGLVLLGSIYLNVLFGQQYAYPFSNIIYLMLDAHLPNEKKEVNFKLYYMKLASLIFSYASNCNLIQYSL